MGKVRRTWTNKDGAICAEIVEDKEEKVEEND